MAIVFRNGCLKSDGVACTKTRFVMEKVSATTHTHKHKHENKLNISSKFNIKLIFPVFTYAFSPGKCHHSISSFVRKKNIN